MSPTKSLTFRRGHKGCHVSSNPEFCFALIYLCEVHMTTIRYPHPKWSPKELSRSFCWGTKPMKARFPTKNDEQIG